MQQVLVFWANHHRLIRLGLEWICFLGDGLSGVRGIMLFRLVHNWFLFHRTLLGL